MTTNYILTHLTPTTLAQMAADILTHHADTDEISITFHTEDAKAAYDTICETGAGMTSDDAFDHLIDIAIDQLAN